MLLPVRFSFSLLVNIFILVVLLPAMATAEKRVALYDVSQLVLDESPSLRQQAIVAALSQVFVKVAGNEQVLSNPLVEDALQKATAYLSQYRYQSTEETLFIAGDQKPARRLLMRFSEASIQRVFALAQLPMWPDKRPEVLLWLAAQKDNKVMLGTDSRAVGAFKAAADEYGLPISAPLLDLSDRQALPAARLWAMDERAIRAASLRYDLDVLLAGRMARIAITGNNAWKGSFIVLQPSLPSAEQLYLSASGRSEQEVAQQIIAKLSAHLSSLSSIIVSDQLSISSLPSLRIQVSNINDFAAYAGLLSHLGSFPVIASVMVSRVEGDTIELLLGYNDNSDKLLVALSSSDILEVVSSIPSDTAIVNLNSAAVDYNTSAKYRWR